MDTFTDSGTLSGPTVLRPGDAGYEEETPGFQLAFDQRPDLVVPAARPEDVAAAVRYAAGRGLRVGVHATGHGLPGARRGGLLVTTRRLDRLTVDPVARTVRVGAGVRWGAVVAAAAPHGLAPLNGSAPVRGRRRLHAGRRTGAARQGVRLGRRPCPLPRRRHRRRPPPARHRRDGTRPVLGAARRRARPRCRHRAGDRAGPGAHADGGSLSYDGRVVDPAALLRAWAKWTRTVPSGLTSSLAAVPYPDVPALPHHLRGAVRAVGAHRLDGR
ncbi:hypothetical protein GCM10020256_51420 [Streptomyces thermocoprophilus]